MGNLTMAVVGMILYVIWAAEKLEVNINPKSRIESRAADVTSRILQHKRGTMCSMWSALAPAITLHERPPPPLSPSGGDGWR